MNFVVRIFENAVSLILAIVILVAVLTIFGSTPNQRYTCEMKTDNVVADAVCILKVAL